LLSLEPQAGQTLRRVKIESSNRKRRLSSEVVSPWASLVIWILVGAIIFGLPLRILSFGYLPGDDALRHAAKAMSGKPWSEILLLRPEITIDHNPGWHWLLGSLHRLAGWDARQLVVFSVIAMFVVFAVSPLPWLKRTEAWLVSITLILLVFPYYADRLMLGRPLLLTTAVTLVVLSLWTRAENRGAVQAMLVTTILFAISTWIHGSWYLLLLLPAAFLLARRWREAVLLGICWAAGSILGAVLTGHPWTFLKQSASIPFLAFGVNAQSLVTEFEPFSGSYPALIVVAAVLAARKFAGLPFTAILRDPVLWLAIVGWALGFRVVRFWLDWSIPPLALWFGRQFQELLDVWAPKMPWVRVAVASLAALILFAVVANDQNGRWSNYGKFECLDAKRPELAGWLPDPGGVLYSVDQTIFYETFFCNPHGDWRYALGFEPSFMRTEDLAVYQELCSTLNALRACAPWVKRMTLADRLVLRSGPDIRPAIPELEWHYAANRTWVGRLPRTQRSETNP
jgi:hypothetical protein